ncbi:EP300-interacting inhibitor of differentiation 3 [Stomoxys calcitrans]|uniref:Non-structural maintenance of chromosomes element 4 n=1 Tax=Stomoxys calcitrans TaxID=35570 RepID=A0A1I8P8Q0_STOCA|nr:EP300-interacting inhibitor of differentiation 3 [Stomoxys calcitrans]
MNQSATQSTDRKQRYKILYDDLTNLHNTIGVRMVSETCRAVRNIIQTCDDIHREGSIGDKLENPSEVVIDAQIIKSTHESISKLLLANSEFNDGIYQNAISALISHNDTEDWRDITRMAIRCCSTVATKSSMLGAIDIEPKERVVKERQQRKRTVLSQEQRPETINQLKRDDRGAEKVNILLKQVSDLFRANNRQPIPYYQLIIDPHNFMNTVENAFQMAFLARDGNIAIESGIDGNPQVRLASKDEIEMHPDTSQSICSLNMDLCARMIDLYDIKEAMLYVPTDIDEETQLEQIEEEGESD